MRHGPARVLRISGLKSGLNRWWYRWVRISRSGQSEAVGGLAEFEGEEEASLGSGFLCLGEEMGGYGDMVKGEHLGD